MGAWSVSLYGNDAAADLRGDFAVFAKIPGDAAELVARLKDRFCDLRDPESECYPDLWLALADQLHAHGLEDAETIERARRLIEEGADLSVKAELGMGARDLDKRRAVLDELLRRWTTPVAKPKSRNVFKAPEPHVFAPGAIVAYPTSRGEAGNPYARQPEDFPGWRQDGWGSFVVLAAGHAMDYFAWNAIGRLGVHGPDKPSFAACRDNAIENQPWFMNPSGADTRAVQVGAFSRLRARRMRLEQLGEVMLDPARVAALCPEALEAPRPPPPVPMSVLEWWGEKRPGPNTSDLGVAAPGPAIPLASLIV